MGSHTFDAYNAMLDLFGPAPLLVNGTVLTLEHVMQRLEIIENKVATIEWIANLDKKIHNHITQYGSRVGVTLKNLKEKEPIVNEKLDLDSARIGKLEDIITNLGSVFSSMKNTPKLSGKLIHEHLWGSGDRAPFDSVRAEVEQRADRGSTRGQFYPASGHRDA